MLLFKHHLKETLSCISMNTNEGCSYFVSALKYAWHIDCKGESNFNYGILYKL